MYYPYRENKGADQRVVTADLRLCFRIGKKPVFLRRGSNNLLIVAKYPPYCYCLYRKVPKFSDVRKLCCNLPKIQEKTPNLWVFRQKNANEIANSEDADQTAPLEQSDLGLHCLPRPICPKTLDHYCSILNPYLLMN